MVSPFCTRPNPIVSNPNRQFADVDDNVLIARRTGDDDELDFDVLVSLVGYHLRRAQVAVFSDFAGQMAGEQITPGQFGVIALIGANPGLTQSALARAVGIERSTMVAVIDTLESRGIVDRRASPVDRRSYALVLTGTGQEMLARLKPMVADHEARIGGGLTDDERRQLIRLLQKLANDV